MKGLKTFTAVLMAAVIAVSMIFMAGCKKEEKVTDASVVAEINGNKITVEEAKFYIYMQQANYEAYYLAYGQEIDWSGVYEDDNGEKTTLEDVIKKESLEIIYKQKLFEEKAKEWGIELNDEDKAKVKEEVAEFLNESDKDLLDKIGSNETLVTAIYESVQLYSKVCEKILADNPVVVTDEEAHQGMFTLAIVDSEAIDSPEDTANAILKRVQGGEDIKYVADKFGVETSTGNVGKGDMNNELEDVCLSLKTGESGVAEVDGYYYVVYCDNDDDTEATEIAKEDIQSEKEAEAISNYYEEVKSKANIKVYDKVLKTIKIENHIFTAEDMQTSAEGTTATGESETTGDTEGDTTGEVSEENTTESES